MSSILKALKKVEEEKAAQRTTAPLAGDVAGKYRSRQQKSRWKILAALAAVAVLAVLTTYAAMGGFSVGKQGTAPRPAGNPAESTIKTGVSSPAVQVQPAQAVAVSAQGLNGQAKPVQQSTPAAAKAAPSLTGSAVAVPAVAVKSGMQPFLRTTTGAVSIGEDHVGFKVSGIAWQKESSSRLAVVNGIAVTQGATVDGAKVVEILPDRVRLSHGGRTFEILLGKINQYR
ncbi:general secretion pathway protein GspB [Geotalea sp. SG265]|uniref:general secretion pathway protein GspB n=1 Tax=Geotalea sp. SG265 TaxID=2922867 RepID=UPI001FAFA081|nr:general secretion pathway protein GspB [Geotalea sp. SG265]